MKTVRIDGRYYDITANVRKTDAEEFVYSIQLNESEIKRASPPIGFHEKSVRSGEQRSTDSIAQNGADVNSENESVRWSLNNLSKDPRHQCLLCQKNGGHGSTAYQGDTAVCGRFLAGREYSHGERGFVRGEQTTPPRGRTSKLETGQRLKTRMRGGLWAMMEKLKLLQRILQCFAPSAARA